MCAERRSAGVPCCQGFFPVYLFWLVVRSTWPTRRRALSFSDITSTVLLWCDAYANLLVEGNRAKIGRGVPGCYKQAYTLHFVDLTAKFYIVTAHHPGR